MMKTAQQQNIALIHRQNDNARHAHCPADKTDVRSRRAVREMHCVTQDTPVLIFIDDTYLRKRCWQPSHAQFLSHKGFYLSNLIFIQNNRKSSGRGIHKKIGMQLRETQIFLESAHSTSLLAF